MQGRAVTQRSPDRIRTGGRQRSTQDLTFDPCVFQLGLEGERTIFGNGTETNQGPL